MVLHAWPTSALASVTVFHIVYVRCCLTGDINFTARPQPGQARTGPGRVLASATVLMMPEPCHCCEESDRTPSIQVAGNSSQGLSDSQPKARNSGRLQKRGEKRQPTHFKHHQQRLHVNTNDVSSHAHGLMQQTGLSCRAALSSR